MAQETVTEFRTVEEQKTRTLCDNCNRTDEEAQILTVAINPKVEKESWEEIDVIEAFDDEVVAHNKVREAKLEQAGYTTQYGIGTVTHNQHKDMRASAKADVCSECVFDLFGVEIPEDEEVEEIELGNGEMNINTSKEVTSVWPQFDIPEWSSDTERGWKRTIIMWPIVFGHTIVDTFFDVYCGDENRTKGYLAGSLGTIVWISVLFAILYFSSILVLVV
jgi:hypothetical protein